MSEEVTFKFKINFPVIFFTVLTIHVLCLAIQGIPAFDFNKDQRDNRTVLNIRRVKTPKIENPITNMNLPVTEVKRGQLIQPKAKSEPTPVSLKDLMAAKPQEIQKTQRPGTRPEVATVRKLPTVKQLSAQDSNFKDYAKSYPGGFADLSSVDTGAFKVSDATIGIENPDGVEPDELNKNELVYYSFQRRMLIGYINAIVKEIEKFQKKHRHFQLDANAKILMTARLTYDSEGNVKQIKMIRWSNLDPLQNVFEETMKNLNKLSNPPKDLWTKSGEFNVFYSWVISNG